MKTIKLLTATLFVLLLTACLLFTLCGAAFAAGDASAEASASGEASAEYNGVLDTDGLFTARDLEQEPDLSDAVKYTVSDGQDIHITAEGVYVLSGTASEVTVYVEAENGDKVQIVLDAVSITNKSFPCIYVKNADKVFVTTVADSALSVTGKFKADGSTNTDGVIFCRSDLVLNGAALLKIDSYDNGVVCKDDLKVTGGSFEITTESKGLEANDSILITDAKLTVVADSDGLYAENDDDDTLGYVYIKSGELTITADDDGIHALSVVEIDSGNITITAKEGIEATYVQVHNGVINITADDNGLNGVAQSTAYEPTIELNDGAITIVMTSDKKDAIDCGGSIIINGGAIDVTGNCVYEGEGLLSGGTLIVNGEQVTEIPNKSGGFLSGLFG